ncbi:MAG: NUDIX hydrolase [Phycisphaerales bacterium]|nr:NUDIX hydrolase [Phycisphaerales bacterium]
MARWLIRERSVVFRAVRFVVERSLRRREGEPEASERDYYRLLFRDFAIVCAVTDDGQIVLVRQFRHGNETQTLELPGGILDEHEADPMAAARRELEEETGFGGGDWSVLGEIDPAPALQNNRAVFFLARGVRRLGPPRPDAGEDVAIELTPAAKIGELIATGAIRGALMVAGLALLREKGGV